MSGVIVHEWIEETGGAEKVVESFAEIFPDAPLLCLWNDAPRRFSNSVVRESAIARTPIRKSKVAALPIMPLQWRRWKAGDATWALVSSHLFAHHVRFRDAPDIERYIYVHTPARYIWSPDLDPRGSSAIARTVAPMFRKLDARRAKEGGCYAANSDFVAERVRRYWGIEAKTIYPPVAVSAIQSRPRWVEYLDRQELDMYERLPQDFLLAASRLVPYKRIDEAIRAAALTDLPLVVAGDGPDRARLESVAESEKIPVYFLGRVSDALLFALYQKSLAYIFLGVEDFGIMPVEAMAAGASVVGNSVGGVAETVMDGITGALCDPKDSAQLTDAVRRAIDCRPEKSAAHAQQFDSIQFMREITNWVGPEKVNSPRAHVWSGDKK
ncbi:Glycosyltransferase involved in cell wall bisynthesis [Rhodococcus pyridinivorans]|uniref:glycosyltransferase n=1 Tax=Rhodococcus pyridinivorans TaxID=103816 RepID=UPI00089C11EC|nr:glycosyltransferase [Rhodococcus pyridinivorans]QXF82804.1 glycosyltransferase family 4 protein [Rhodococcus pyridinivorans]SEC26697.1 Glycosyltransferase involved in cell wall bisynthesis [Rhodococcus pyridinivorans]